MTHAAKKQTNKPFAKWLRTASPPKEPQGRHSAAEHRSAREWELNRMSAIDLKCGASSPKHPAEKWRFSYRSGKPKAVNCRIQPFEKCHRTCDASQVWTWLWNTSSGLFLVPSTWLREPNLSSEQRLLVTFSVRHHPAKAGFIWVCLVTEI